MYAVSAWRSAAFMLPSAPSGSSEWMYEPSKPTYDSVCESERRMGR